MRRSQERWPVQRRRHYALRVLKTLCLVLLGRPLPYGLLARALDLLGRDLDDLVNGAVRAFPASGNASDDLLSGLRRRDRKSTRLNSSHANISYAVFCLK